MPAIFARCATMPKSSSHLEQACMRGSAGTSKQCHSQSAALYAVAFLSLDIHHVGQRGILLRAVFCREFDFLAFQSCETQADSSEDVTPSAPHSGPSLSSTQAPFNGSLVTLQFTLDQPKPRPRPLAALAPLPILLPLADGIVPLPLPTDVPAAV